VIAALTADSLRHWNIDELSADLAKEVGCSPLVATLMRIRGASGKAKAMEFLSTSLLPLMGSLDLGTGGSKAEEIYGRIGPGSRVVVYGDYDVDGVSATTLAARLFSRRGAGVGYFIPHRHQEGYGLHEKIVRRIAQRGCDVLVAVDCGTSSGSAIETARSLGLEVIVFDHHLPQETSPEGSLGNFLVNPQVGGCQEAKQLCGTAVLWAWAWKTVPEEREWLCDNLGLVALATVADCVPLGPLNRALVRNGLAKIREGAEPGLSALSAKLGIDLDTLDSESLAMKVVPCLNAPGRLELADLSVKVLSFEPPSGSAVDDLVALNRKRQGLTAKIMEEATPFMEGKACCVAGKEDWPVGVLSGVASRICSEMGVPVVLAAPVGSGLVRGTLRVPKGGDAVSVLKGLSASLEEWGGHRQAAGFSVKREGWPSVRDSLEAILAGLELEEENSTDVLDAHPESLTLGTLDEIESLGPFGMGNPAPLFYVDRKRADRINPLGKTGQHVKIECGTASIVAFRSPELLRDSDLVEGWVYRARRGSWKGSPRVELFLERPVLADGLA